MSNENNLPNIIYILADDMGYGDIECYNPQSKIPTPNMNQLAGEGIIFTDAHAASSVCTPSRYAILTGRYCWRTKLQHGVLYNYEPPLIETQQETVASLLKRKGYSTACIGKWHLGLNYQTKEGQEFDFDKPLPWHSRIPKEEDDKIDFSQPMSGGPVELGFDYFFGTSCCPTCNPPFAYIEGDSFIEEPTVYKIGDLPEERSGYHAPTWDHKEADITFTRKAVEYIDKSANSDSPYFLYLAASAPHEPCVDEVTPELALHKSQAGPRGDLVVLFDWMVGQVMEAVEKSGQKDNTLIIVTSDNGAKPGCLGKTYGHKSCGDWRGYKGYIWEGGHREPFICSWPNVIAAGSRCDNLVGLHDLMATVAELTEQPIAENVGEDSVSFLDMLKSSGKSPQTRKHIVHHSCRGVFSIRDNEWKLIVDCDNSGDAGRGYWGGEGTGPSPDMKGQLYNLKDDPFECINLIDEFPDRVSKMKLIFEKIKENGGKNAEAHIDDVLSKETP